MKYQGIIFDLDGTLVDSIPGIAIGMAQATQSLGLGVIPEKDIRRFVGKGAWQLCEKSLLFLGQDATDEAVISLEEAFVQEYAHTWNLGTTIYKEMNNFLSMCVAKGINMAILTNKPESIARELVKDVFSEKVDFSPVFGFSDRFPRKPDPIGIEEILNIWGLRKKDVCFVGDSVTDAETGFNAKMKTYIVSWGYDDNPRISAEKFGAQLVDQGNDLIRNILM